MTERQRKLTPEQDKAIERIQLAGVVLFIGIMIAMRILARRDVMDFWTLLVVGFSAMVAVVLVLGLVVSRVEARPYGEVMGHSFRAMGDDLKGAPARVRRRVADMFARRRSR